MQINAPHEDRETLNFASEIIGERYPEHLILAHSPKENSLAIMTKDDAEGLARLLAMAIANSDIFRNAMLYVMCHAFNMLGLPLPETDK